MMIYINGKMVDTEDITESRLPDPESNYKYKSREWFGQNKIKKKLDKTYSIYAVRKMLQGKGLYIEKITPYKGNRYTHDYYRVTDSEGNVIMDAYLYEIGKFLEEQDNNSVSEENTEEKQEINDSSSQFLFNQQRPMDTYFISAICDKLNKHECTLSYSVSAEEGCDDSYFEVWGFDKEYKTKTLRGICDWMRKQGWS